MTDLTTPPKVRHPAKWNGAALTAAAELIREEGTRLDRPPLVFDPFAGVGLIHTLRDQIGCDTTGIELEPEWAGQHPDTKVGNALDLQFEANTFDVLCTSPTFGNRMADHHTAQDPCSKCGGELAAWAQPEGFVCKACGGTGLSRRNTYRHALGRDLSRDSSASIQWGTEYRSFHERAWSEAIRVLQPGGLVLVNIKNHLRAGVEQKVSEWHINCWILLGATVHSVQRIPARGNRQGANHDKRIDAELLLAFRTASLKGDLFSGH